MKKKHTKTRKQGWRSGVKGTMFKINSKNRPPVNNYGSTGHSLYHIHLLMKRKPAHGMAWLYNNQLVYVPRLMSKTKHEFSQCVNEFIAWIRWTLKLQVSSMNLRWKCKDACHNKRKVKFSLDKLACVDSVEILRLKCFFKEWKEIKYTPFLKVKMEWWLRGENGKWLTNSLWVLHLHMEKEWN